MSLVTFEMSFDAAMKLRQDSSVAEAYLSGILGCPVRVLQPIGDVNPHEERVDMRRRMDAAESAIAGLHAGFESQGRYIRCIEQRVAALVPGYEIR